MGSSEGVLLPQKIVHAIALVATYHNSSQSNKNLSPGEKTLLVELLRVCDRQDPRTPIRVKKETIESRTGMCLRTIYKHLARLEESGWIHRQEQVKKRSCGFLIGLINLSSMALQTLFPTKPATSYHDDRQSSTQNRQNKLVEKNAHACKDSKEVNTSSISFQDRQKYRFFDNRVPSDCAPLLNFLPGNLIFKLMKIASRHGKRLGDIVEYIQAKKIQIKNHTGFIKFLVKQDIDFKFVARMTAAEASREEAKSSEQQNAEATFNQFLSVSKNTPVEVGGSFWMQDKNSESFIKLKSKDSQQSLGSLHFAQFKMLFYPSIKKLLEKLPPKTDDSNLRTAST